MMMKRSTTSKRRSSSVGAVNSESVVVDAAKKIKTKLREEREMKKLFESIATRLLSEQDRNIKSEIDNRVSDMVNKSMSEVRNELFAIQSAVSSRLSNMENKLNTMSEKMEEIKVENKKKLSIIHEELISSTNGWKNAWENERNKRLTSLKKTSEEQAKLKLSLETMIGNNKTETSNIANSLNDDLRIHAKDISLLKERMDDMLMKQFAQMSTSNRANLTCPNTDANQALESLAQRLQRLELAVAGDEDLNNSFEANFSARSSVPLRSSMNQKNTLGRMRRLEEHMLELQSQIKENEIDVQQLKSQLVHKVRSFHSTSASPSRDPSRNRDTVFHQDEEDRNMESKDLEKRIKKLADNTTKAVRSLSSGLSEVQQATLNLYSWTDQVHDAFERVGHKVDLSPNLCPRAKVSRSSRPKFEFSL